MRNKTSCCSAGRIRYLITQPKPRCNADCIVVRRSTNAANGCYAALRLFRKHLRANRYFYGTLLPTSQKPLQALQKSSKRIAASATHISKNVFQRELAGCQQRSC